MGSVIANTLRGMTQPVENRFEFRIGDAFPDRDPTARYVMRLSTALGDLRIAGEYAVRDDQPEHERLYFIRLFSSHMREAVLLLDPPNAGVVPNVEAFIAALPSGARDLHADRLRESHGRVLALLRRQFTERPGLNLRQELRRMRNQFFHYHADANSDADLGDAIAASADDDGVYVIRELPDDKYEMRAEYADIVGIRLVHPFEGDNETVRPIAEELHGDILNLLGPLSTYIQQAEAAYLTSRAAGVVTLVRPDGSPSDARKP